MKTNNLEGRSGASLIKKTVYLKEKELNVYYVDQLTNGLYAVSLHEQYITTFKTEEEAISYVDMKCS